MVTDKDVRVATAVCLRLVYAGMPAAPETKEINIGEQYKTVIVIHYFIPVSYVEGRELHPPLIVTEGKLVMPEGSPVNTLRFVLGDIEYDAA